MYLEHFGFHEKPFHITPDPRFFYPSLVSQEAYASLFYGITEKKGFVALTGEVGTGKTTLLRRVMLSLANSVNFAFVYNTTWTFDEVLDAICSDFALPLPASGKRFDKVQALNSFLLEQLTRGMTAAVLVDEAHNLSADDLENLRLLSNLETSSEKLLQIVLVGQNELETKLMQPNLRQVKDRIAIWTRLDRLKTREVGAFIFHRLHVAGYEKEDLFTPEAIDRIAAYSQGSPRQINIICDNALLAAYGTYQNQVSAEIIKEVAQDLGLIHKKAKNDAPLLDSAEDTSSAVKELPQADVIVETPLSGPNPEIFQKEETWKREQQTLYFVLVRSKFTKYVIFLALLIGTLVVFVFQDSGASLIGANSLVSRVVDFLQMRPSPTQPVILPRATIVLPTPNNSSRIAEQRGEKSQEEAGLKGQENIASVRRGYDDSKVTEAAPMQPARMEQPSFIRTTTPPLDPERGEKQAQSLEDYRQSSQFITMSHGLTILALVSRLYGNQSLLVLGLLKEANPQITDLDKVFEGDRLWIPPLTRETLLRQQPDGSYQLKFSWFREKREAERCRQALLAQGYTAVIVPQQISSTLKLYRIEIEGLREATAIENAWELVRSQDLAAFSRSRKKA